MTYQGPWLAGNARENKHGTFASSFPDIEFIRSAGEETKPRVRTDNEFSDEGCFRSKSFSLSSLDYTSDETCFEPMRQWLHTCTHEHVPYRTATDEHT